MDSLEGVQRDARCWRSETIDQAADVPQQAGRLAGIALHNRSTRRISRVSRNACRSKRRAVQEERIRAIDGDRMPRRRGVEFIARRKATLAQARRKDARRPDPRSSWHALCGASNPGLQLVDRSEVSERLRGLCFRHAERVHMRIDEPGDDRAAAAVDDARLAADMDSHVLVRPDRDEPAIADRHGAGRAEPVVDGYDAAVEQHEIGLARRRLSPRIRGERCDQQDDSRATPQHDIHSSRFAATNSSSARWGYARQTRSISSACPMLSVSRGSRQRALASRPWRRNTS